MNESQREGGGTLSVETDVILHTVNSDRGTSSGPAVLGNDENATSFLKDTVDENPPAAIPVEREYMLDGPLMENHHFDGNISYISKSNHVNSSSDKGVVDLPLHTDSSVPKLSAGTFQSCVSGKNGISQNHIGTSTKPPHSGDLSSDPKDKPNEEAGGSEGLSRETSVRGQCRISDTPSAPDTPCNAAGAKPRPEGLALSVAPTPHTAHQPDRDTLSDGSRASGQPAEEEESAQSQKEPDLVIEVGGQRISAHKSVLAEKSDYFKARLSRDILKVKGVNSKTLRVLIDYVYTGRMSVCQATVVDVITGAKVLQIPCAVQAATDTMAGQLTTDNCYQILAIAKKQRLGELKDTAYRFMSDNFLQILRDPSVYGRLTGSERDLVLRRRMEGRQTLAAVEVDDVFERVGSRPASRCSSRPQSPSSVTSMEDSHMIYCFSQATSDWRPLTAMPEEIATKGCGICTMYNYLFVAGGIKGSGDKGKVSDKVFCYNPVNNRWAQVRPLNQARAQLKLVSMDGLLYAIGGECLFTVEKYDPRVDRWTTVAPLPKGAFAVAHEATTCSGELYVSGGSLFYRLLKYDSKRDEWQECPYNNSRKRSTDMVALKSFIYRFDVNRDQGINVFKYNTIVKMWHDCASQRLGSSLPFRCVVIGNCIYCVNKSQTLQFVVEEENAYFVEEPLRAPVEAKGVLFPFVLSLPERPERVAQ